MELWQLDATDLAHLIRTGRASAREAVTSVLARVDAVNPKLNAIVRRLDDEALEAADAADAARARGEALGPLHGVPVTTKANVGPKGLPATAVGPWPPWRVATIATPAGCRRRWSARPVPIRSGLPWCRKCPAALPIPPRQPP